MACLQAIWATRRRIRSRVTCPRPACHSSSASKSSSRGDSFSPKSVGMALTATQVSSKGSTSNPASASTGANSETSALSCAVSRTSCGESSCWDTVPFSKRSINRS